MNGYVRKRGSKWYYCFDITSNSGKRKRVERVGGRTKKDAENALRKALNDYETGYIEPLKTSLEQYLSDWLENHVKQLRKVTTLNRYKSITKNYLSPSLGSIPLSVLKPIHIDNMLSELRKKEISDTTIQHIYDVLNTALNRAVKMRQLTVNPCMYVDRPKRNKFVANTLTVAEFNEILGHLDVSLYRDYVFHIALQLVLELGLRRGELSGLEWNNVDYDNNTISIVNNVLYSEGKTFITTPKTDESTRTIYISDHLKQLLKSYKTIQNGNKLHYGSRLFKNIYDNKEYDFIFTWENGKKLHPLYYTQKFSKLLKKSSIEKRIRFHDLRHTNATLLLSQGVDFKTIQERLGHTDINTTLNIYSHVNLEMQKNATEKLTSILNGDKMATK